MTVEDQLIRWSGLDPVAVHKIATDTVHMLGVVQDNMDKAIALLAQANAVAEQTQKLLAEVQAFVPVVQAEMPRAKTLTANIKSQIAAWEARQKQLNTGWR